MEDWRAAADDSTLQWRFADPYDETRASFDAGDEEWSRDLTAKIRVWPSYFVPGTIEVLEFGVDGERIGYVFGRRGRWPPPDPGPSVPTYVIPMLALDRHFRGAGDRVTGRPLIDEILDFMQEHVRRLNAGVPSGDAVGGIGLQVHADNGRAIEVYGRNGFEVTSGTDLIRMWRSL